MDGVPGDKDFVVTIKTFNVPDKEHRFFLRHRKNAFYEDDLLLKVNAKGLLETVNLTVEDKGPAVIDKAVETIIDVARISASGGVGPFFRDSSEITEIPLKPFHVVFDPFSAKQRSDAATMLAECGFQLSFPEPQPAQKWLAADAKQIESVTSRLSEAAASNPKIADGILFRPPTAIEMQISALNNSTGGILQHVFVRLPNPIEIATLDASRAFLIKKKNHYSLEDGDLIQVDYNRPSQALAFVSIPASVAHKVAEAIPSIIEIQDKRASRVPPELAAQKAQLDAQTALLNSQAALIEANKKLKTGSGDETNRALTRAALAGRAKAEEDEAKARQMNADADQKEANARSVQAEAAQKEAAARIAKAEEEARNARRDPSTPKPEEPKKP